MREIIKYSKRIVVKLGTGLLAENQGTLNRDTIKHIVSQISTLIHEGRQVVLVTSGAIGAGFQFLNKNKRPTTLPLLQASASIGQTKLMHLYDDLFDKEGINIAQILLTKDDLKIRKRYLNVKNTLNTLLQHNILPIINENDSVSVDEIRFGDNDLLSALVANVINCDILINLTNVDGVMKKSPDGKSLGNEVISEVKGVPKSIFAHTTTQKSMLGSGGIESKLQAAKILTTAGEFMLIANGHEKDILLRIMDGEQLGTLFVPQKGKMESRKRWIAFFHQTKGTIFVDDGARDALLNQGKSLLPKGITSVDGKFHEGDIVLIFNEKTGEIGKGLVNFNSEELCKIKSQHSNKIEKILGYKSYDEAIHRNNMVITFSE